VGVGVGVGVDVSVSVNVSMGVGADASTDILSMGGVGFSLVYKYGSYVVLPEQCLHKVLIAASTQQTTVDGVWHV
jgi:hypothetical protein